MGVNTYNIIKTVYSNNKCAVKIGNKQTDSSLKDGCETLSPTLFSVYINELVKLLEQSAVYDSTIKIALFIQDLQQNIWIRTFQKYNFTLDTTKIDHATNYTYLALKFSADWNLNLAVNELKEKIRRVFIVIKKKIYPIWKTI